ncbi:MAG: TIGR04283 family arsenosugar biosynthesis glycosyltransferase [Ketobacter sp.]
MTSDCLLGTVVIPVLNEAQQMDHLLLDVLTKTGGRWHVIVVDGGSRDATVGITKRYPVELLSAPAGRAFQMNMGASRAKGELVLFLHADTRLPMQFNTHMEHFIAGSLVWGRFNVRLDSAGYRLRVVANLMNLRSRISAIATGDQAIFMKLDTFREISGFDEIPLMEDIDISKRLKQLSRPFCIADPVVTSSRRWLQDGVVYTILLMWFMRLAYWLGVSPQRLWRWYYGNSL